ncbi:sulfur carrier protein ThiS [Wenzhouxiangella sp. XN24]|uniref:sulfur carrier protein ThiS n=1 Tax=Wenzhouxiangella sp. XN24 TaxID=2713569 RepID=UPI0013EBF8D1|nr:sulfur carrier protein ThiS [Wenzhouxiangella sp. XN24]NGX17593.1 sulfur carrier protein ThiS [Wenzhouxiangella sp. XN24]
MEIILNGKPKNVADGLTAAELVADLALSGRRYAMEVNGELLPKRVHADHELSAGDRVEIVQAVGGG